MVHQLQHRAVQSSTAEQVDPEFHPQTHFYKLQRCCILTTLHTHTPAQHPKGRAGTDSRPAPTRRATPPAPASTSSAANGRRHAAHAHTSALPRCISWQCCTCSFSLLNANPVPPPAHPRAPHPAPHLDLAHQVQVAAEDAHNQRLRVARPHHAQAGQAVKQRTECSFMPCGGGVAHSVFRSWARGNVYCSAVVHAGYRHLCRSRCGSGCQSCLQSSPPAPPPRAPDRGAARWPSAAPTASEVRGVGMRG